MIFEPDQTATNAINWICQKPKCGLFYGMSMGKTVCTLTAFDVLKRFGAVSKMLVIAPKQVASSGWHAEVDKWNHLNHLTVSFIGSGKDFEKGLLIEADIYTIGIDNVKKLLDRLGGNLPPEYMIVLDESTKAKNQGAVRTKVLMKASYNFTRCVILSGTPASNGYENLWSQIFLLDQGIRLGYNITTFRDSFMDERCIPGTTIIQRKLKPGKKEIVDNLIKDICLSATLEERGNSPKFTIEDVVIRAPEYIIEQYKRFRSEKVLEVKYACINSRFITVTHAAALANKLQQFSSGFVYDENKDPHHIHYLKIMALGKILTESTDNIVVGVNYIEEIEMIKRSFPFAVVYKGDKQKKLWNERKIRMLIINPKSGGHGLNIQFGGSVLVWFSLTFDLELYEQLNMRLPRPGQTREVKIYQLILEGTDDSRIVKSLSGKSKTQNSLLQALKKELKKELKATII